MDPAKRRRTLPPSFTAIHVDPMADASNEGESEEEEDDDDEEEEVVCRDDAAEADEQAGKDDEGEQHRDEQR
eukprot:1383263-Pyramimonas_sp.AAC.1